MGSFYMKCGATNTAITDGMEVYSFILVENKNRKLTQGTTYVHDHFKMIPISIKGLYSDYGTVESDNTENEYLDRQLESFDKDFILYYNDEQYTLTELYNEIGTTNTYRDEHIFHWFVSTIGGFCSEDITIMSKNDDLFKDKYNLSMMMVNGRFIEKLLENHRVNPYRKFADDDSKCVIRKYFTLLGHSNDGYIRDLYLDEGIQSTIFMFLNKHMNHTGTAIMPSNYGGQEVDLASLKILSEFYSEELTHSHKVMYDEDITEIDEDYVSIDEAIQTDLGGTHWENIDGKYTYTDY